MKSRSTCEATEVGLADVPLGLRPLSPLNDDASLTVASPGAAGHLHSNRVSRHGAAPVKPPWCFQSRMPSLSPIIDMKVLDATGWRSCEEAEILPTHLQVELLDEFEAFEVIIRDR